MRKTGMNCDKGAVDGQILLAPTNPPAIQGLRFTPRPEPARQPPR